jgi:CSLREA domain-containing protein
MRAGATASLGAILLAAGAEAGPTFTVNSLLDVPGGGSLTDGVCETATGNHVCTLRAAVMEANHVAGAGATVVVPAATYFLSLAPAGDNGETSGDLDVNAAMALARIARHRRRTA